MEAEASSLEMYTPQCCADVRYKGEAEDDGYEGVEEEESEEGGLCGFEAEEFEEWDGSQ